MSIISDLGRPRSLAAVPGAVILTRAGRLPAPLPFSAGSFDRRVAGLFHLERAQSQATTTLKTAQLTVARLISTSSGTGMSDPFPVENSYVVSLQLRDAGAATLWKAGRLVATPPLVEGAITIAHLDEEPTFHLPDPFESLLLHIPQIAFDELADQHQAPRISELASEEAVLDPVINNLGRALVPLIEAPRAVDRLLFDHVTFAIQARLALVYGRLPERKESRVLHLSPWQARRAMELLTADLAEEPSIDSVARACGLTVGRFVRAFRGTTGMPPHRWLRRFRVERAKELLVHSTLSLAQVAYDCGFADQSHFSRVFVASIGATPGAWRRARRA